MNKFTKAIAAIMLMMVVAVSCTKPDNSINSVSVSGTIEQFHDYVDLGLPSGTLWATCNVGADSPESYGDYYAWGECYRKIDFLWQNYEFGGCGRKKYCKEDGLLVLEPEDDVAHIRWHCGWLIPTKEQWEELLQNTTNIVANMNGVKGRLFTATNGNTLFLPAAGLIDSEDQDFGFYWSSSVVEEYLDHAWSICIDGNDCTMFIAYREKGFTIRPVHPAL